MEGLIVTISREMRLRSTVLREAQRAPMQVVHSLAGQLSKDGEVCVCFDSPSDEQDGVMESIRRSLAGFCGDVLLADSDTVSTEGGPTRAFALFQTDAVIHFSEAPWGETSTNHDARLLEMAQRARVFTAVYRFNGSHDVTLGAVAGGQADGCVSHFLFVNNVSAQCRVVGLELPFVASGPCRVDVRVDPL